MLISLKLMKYKLNVYLKYYPNNEFIHRAGLKQIIMREIPICLFLISLVFFCFVRIIIHLSRVLCAQL